MPARKKLPGVSRSKKEILKAEMTELTTGEVKTSPLTPGEPDGLDDLGSLCIENADELTLQDRTLIKRMAALQMSAREIQSCLQIPQAKWDLSLEMQALYMEGLEVGKATLRRMQWLTAKRNPIMQIFLGKQYLGQADRVEQKVQEKEPEDARIGFANKLKNIIDITPERETPEDADGRREGSGQVLLAHVGEGQSDGSDEGGLAEPGDDEDTDSELAE